MRRVDAYYDDQAIIKLGGIHEAGLDIDLLTAELRPQIKVKLPVVSPAFTCLINSRQFAAKREMLVHVCNKRSKSKSKMQLNLL